MGQFSFHVPGDLSPDERDCLARAATAGGYDLTPIPTRSTLNDGVLKLDRDTHESCHLLSTWPIEGIGRPVSMSATLRERAEPYRFLIELARGKVNQVRTQVAEWETCGLTLKTTDTQDLREMSRLFGRAALDPEHPDADSTAATALRLAYEVGDRLTLRFADLLLASRNVSEGERSRYGARLSAVPDAAATEVYRQTFTAARLVPDWRAIEHVEARCDWDQFDALVDWAVENELLVSVGPLIDLTSGTCPSWLTQWEGDLPSLAAFMSDFVETAVARYKDRVQSWIVFGGLNQADALGLGEDDRLRLAARLLESARQTAPNAELGISIAMPWGDYLTQEEYTYSPLIFADTLLRGGYSISKLELELLFEVGSRPSRPRTVLDCYRLLDLFALLGVPLGMLVGGPHPQPDRSGTSPELIGNSIFDMMYLGLSVQQVRSVYWANWTTSTTDNEGTASAIWLPDSGATTRHPSLVQLRELCCP